MDPAIWLLIGAASVVACLALGFWAGHSVGAAPAQRLKDRNAILLEQVAELLDQGDAGHMAARAMVDVERRISRAALLPPADGLRVLYTHSAPAPETPDGEA